MQIELKSLRKSLVAGVIVILGISSGRLLAEQLSGGGYHTVRVNTGLVTGLGDGTYGQLGASPSGVPISIGGLSEITDVAAGGFSTLALKSDGTVWFLGESTIQHTTPHGTPNLISTPVQVPSLSGIDAIAAGHRHFLALDIDTGQLYAWGHNGSGQVGNAGLRDVVDPIVVLTGITTMAAGDGFSLAVKSDGTLWAWGRNTHGQLGLGDTADRTSPTLIAGITTATSVAAGGQHSLIILADGSVLATGNNDFGQLGLGTSNPVSTPTIIPSLAGVTQVTAGYFHSASLNSEDQISIWGRNFEGQCGGGNQSPVTFNSPQNLTGVSGTPTAIECGYHFTLIQMADGSATGMGSNTDGQLDGSSLADQDESPKIFTPQNIPLSPDESPPSPDPTTFFSAPSPTAGNAITMTATTAVDASEVEYFFENTSGGGNDSGWQDSAIYVDIGLIPGRQYSYRVRARDKSPAQNQTAFSNSASARVATVSSVNILNQSFEADENTSGDGAFSNGASGNFGGELTAWIRKSGATSEVAVGWKDIPTAQRHPNPPTSGRESQVLSLQSGSSVLNTTQIAWSGLKEGDELTLTLALGMRDSSVNWNEKTFFGLTDGDADLSAISLSDTAIHSGIIADNPVTGTQIGDGRFTDISITHTILASDLRRSGNIGILIYSEGTGASGAANQSFFDNVRLIRTAAPPNDFSAFISNPAFGLALADQGFGADPDGDAIPNGLEAWFGTHPGEFSNGITGVESSGLVTTFQHPRSQNPPDDLTGIYQWSQDLISWFDGDGSDGPADGSTVLVNVSSTGEFTAVTATNSGNLRRLFLRVGVEEN